MAQAVRRNGRAGLVDQALVLLHPGHVGVTKQTDRVRHKLERGLDGGQHQRHGLIGQAVHEVDVDRADSDAAQRLGDVPGLVHGLDSVYPPAGPGD